jgi:hypothetical protein
MVAIGVRERRWIIFVFPSAGIPFEEKGKQIPAFPRMKPIEICG